MDINLNELSKPATLLIEKISNAIGQIWEPRQIKRIAKAETEAKKISTLANIEISEIERRALIRNIREEGRKQENIEKITQAAIKNLSSNANPEQIEEDWITHFFDRCKNVSNEEMQIIWANLLASEANSSGSISRKTIDLVAILDKYDANLFTSFCSFLVCFENGDLFPLVFNTEHPIYQEMGVNFETLCHLEYLGLINLNTITGFVRKINSSASIKIYYYSKPIQLFFSKANDNQLGPTLALLTKAGKELSVISGSKYSPKFLEYFINEINKKGTRTIFL